MTGSTLGCTLGVFMELRLQIMLLRPQNHAANASQSNVSLFFLALLLQRQGPSSMFLSWSHLILAGLW